MIEEYENIKKTKRNKHPTVCLDKRKSWGCCGCCGSENTVYQGVIWCDNCGTEDSILEEEWFFFQKRFLCKCVRLVQSKKRTIKSDYIKEIKLHKCLDCGAVEGPFCPNNKRHKCWKSPFGERYCRTCGYRRKGYEVS